MVAKYAYEPFGFLTAASGLVDGELHRFTGKPSDLETDLSYFNAKYYDSTLGRFTSSDPLKSSLNSYEYCYNNPLGFIDPSGLIIKQADVENITDDEFDAYLQGITYMLNYNLELNDMFVEMLKSSETISIIEEWTASRYEYESNTVHWNSYMNLYNSVGGLLMSSSQLLAHELGHAWQDIHIVFIPSSYLPSYLQVAANEFNTANNSLLCVLGLHAYLNGLTEGNFYVEMYNIEKVDQAIGAFTGMPVRPSYHYFYMNKEGEALSPWGIRLGIFK